MKRQAILSLFVAILAVAVLSCGCQPKTVIVLATPVAPSYRDPTPRSVKETVVVEKVVQVTQVVEREVEKVVTRKVDETQPRHRPTATPALQATPVYGGEKLPNEQPVDSMFFEGQETNPFIDTEDDHLSTFAMDVDTASYTVARRYIQDGNLPPADAVRVEEFINYFDLAYPDPQDEWSAFAIHLEGAPSPFGGEGYYLIQVGIQGRRVDAGERQDAVLVFVIDTSGSMAREDRLELVKAALQILVEQLRPTDKVGLVGYGSRAYTVLEPTNVGRKQAIMRAIDSLSTGGSTFAEEGLYKGYQMAYRHLEEGKINRVILCSDGVANVGRTGAEGILDTVADYAARGIDLSTVGFGMGNYNDILMEQLADQGNGKL